MTGATPMVSEGLNSFWNFMNLKSLTARTQIRWGMPVEIQTMNPTIAVAGQDLELIRLIYDSLMRLDTEAKAQPWAAESIRPVDAKTYEVTLRPSLMFHDGKPLTTEDVAFSFEYISKHKGSRFYSYAKVVDRTEILSDRQIRFHLSRPYAAFEANSLGLVPILPKHFWEGLLERENLSKPQDYRNVPPIGSGPFKFEYWRPNEELKLSANKKHFQPPKVDELIRIPYADVSGMVAGIRTGEVDIVTWWIPPEAVSQLKQQAGIEVVRAPEVGALSLEFHVPTPPVDRIPVRQALASAVPKEQLLNLLFQGMGSPGSSIIAPGNTFWHNPELSAHEFSLDKARRILKTAGFRWDSEGRIYYPKE